VAAQVQPDVQISLNANENADPLQPTIFLTVGMNISGVTSAVVKPPGNGLQSMTFLWLCAIAFMVSRLASQAIERFHTTAKVKIAAAQRSCLSDIAGYERVKDIIMDFVTLMKDPKAIKNMHRLGGTNIPRGALLFGPPGTGKTALIRAVATEVGWNFFDASATGLIGTILGAGVHAVRDLFDKARTHQPAIIFIDEIDAIGMARNNDRHHEEYKKTLTALLTELDGFSSGSHQIVVFAATNCDPKRLDPALIRSGRFDRHIEVPLPNLVDRAKILMQHLLKTQLHSSLQPDLGANIAKILAKRTFNFSGADLKILVDKAVLVAFKNQATALSEEHLKQACEESAYLSRLKMVGTPKEEAAKLCQQYEGERQEDLVTLILDDGEYRQKHWREQQLKLLGEQKEVLQARLKAIGNMLYSIITWRGREALVMKRKIKSICQEEESIARQNLMYDADEEFPPIQDMTDVKKMV